VVVKASPVAGAVDSGRFVFSGHGMGTILSYRQTATRRPRSLTGDEQGCEIVIFPGVRIERHDLDLGVRLRDSAGNGDFKTIGGSPRPRKTS